MDKKNKKKIEKILKEFFKKLTFDVDFDIKDAENENLKLDLKVEDSQVLIGTQGRILYSLQMILGKIIRKQLDEQIYLDIDINQYKQNKVKHLTYTAKEVADRVSLNNEEEILPEMSSYERRIIHMALASRGGIATESIGQGFERRVVVKPV